MYAKFRCPALRIKKALAIFRELVTTRRRTSGFWDPPSGSKNVFTKRLKMVVVGTGLGHEFHIVGSATEKADVHKNSIGMTVLATDDWHCTFPFYILR